MKYRSNVRHNVRGGASGCQAGIDPGLTVCRVAGSLRSNATYPASPHHLALVIRYSAAPRWSRRALAAIIACVLAGCVDAPTVPRVYTHPADGELWIAVTVPAGLPDLDTWLPYVAEPRDGGDTVSALGRIRSFRRQADEARRADAHSRASALERQAVRVAIHSLDRMPEPHVLSGAISALDMWTRRAEAEVDFQHHPELERAVGDVHSAREAAARLLARGDTAAAVIHLVEGAERVREQAPAAVALRVLDRVEARIRGEAEDDPALERALRLFRGARQALVTGDSRRALRRALYALQLAEGRGVGIASDTASGALHKTIMP